MTCCPWQPFSTWLQLWAFSNKPAALRWLKDTPAALPLTPRYDPHHDCPHPIHWAEFHTSVPRAQVEKELLPQPQRPHKPELISQDNICSGIALAHLLNFTRFARSHFPGLSGIPSLQRADHTTQLSAITSLDSTEHFAHKGVEQHQSQHQPPRNHSPP